MRALKQVVLSYVLIAYSSMPFITNAWAVRTFAAFIAFATAERAYAVDPDGAQGQAFGNALLNQPSSVTYDSNTGTYSSTGSTTMDVDANTGQVTADGTQTGNSMFPAGGDVDLDASIKAGPSITNTSPAPQPSATDLQNLSTGTTERGAAYATVLNGHVQRKALPPMSSLINDPVLQSSKDVAQGTNPDAASVFNGGCTTITTQTVNTGDSHIGKHKSCRITNVVPPTCSVNRIISAGQYQQQILNVPSLTVDGTTIFSFRIFENGPKSSLFSNVHMSDVASGWTGMGGSYVVDQETNDYSKNGGLGYNLTTTQTVTAVDVNNIVGWGQSYIAAGVAISLQPSNYYHTSVAVTQQPTAANGWVVKIQIDDPDNTAHAAAFDAAVTVVSATQTITDIPTGCSTAITEQDFPSANFAAFTPSGSDADAASTYLFECTDAFSSRIFGTATVTAADFGPLLGPLYNGDPGGANAICMNANLRTPTSFTTTSDCYTDIHGNNVCPSGDVTAVTDTCSTLINDPTCTYLNTECIAKNQDGSCSYRVSNYDCGSTQQVVTDSSTNTTISCAGAVKCMGTECVTPANEQNKDFGQAALALGIAQQGALDQDCSSGGVCPLFKGTADTCKLAFGGIANCCEEPAGVSAGEYIAGVYASYHLAQATGATTAMANGVNAAGNAVGTAITQSGAWQAAQSGVTSAWSSISAPFATAWESTVGSLGSQAGVVSEAVSSVSTAFSTGIAVVQQQLMNLAASFMNTVLPGNGLFVVSAVTGDAALSSSGEAMASTLSSVATGIGIAIAVVQLTMLAIQMAYKCEDPEMQLTANKAMKLCHKVGSYCKNFKMGGCQEERESYCCYKTQLGRILQEQLRNDPSQQPALNISWGEPANPHCGGLLPEELGKINWDNVKLDEWIAIATQSGLLSDGTETDMSQRFNMENATQRHAMTYAETKYSATPTPHSGDAYQVYSNMDPNNKTDSTRINTGDSLMQTATP